MVLTDLIDIINADVNYVYRQIKKYKSVIMTNVKMLLIYEDEINVLLKK
jgi:hypothetical protein